MAEGGVQKLEMKTGGKRSSEEGREKGPLSNKNGSGARKVKGYGNGICP